MTTGSGAEGAGGGRHARYTRALPRHQDK